MNSSEKWVQELKQLLAPTTPGWNDPAHKPVLHQQARRLLEQLQTDPGADQQQVQQLTLRLNRRLRTQDSSSPQAATATQSADTAVATLPASAPPDRDALTCMATAFDQAVAQIDQGSTCTSLEKLQEGRFVTGFRAGMRNSGDLVVVKLPAASGWNTRFAECAAALRAEATLLRTVNGFLPEPDPRTCARVITQLEDGELNLPDWPHPVPYSIQSFARGTRLWRSGLLPMRGDQERAGVLLLTQITGLVQCLYAHDLAHRDLKPDALFWDDTADLVEVIDWNSARTPDAQDIAREFNLSLTSLVCEVFLGVPEPAPDPLGFGYTLFATARGVGLSRGVRLLLACLLDPYFSTNALSDVAALHTTLTRLADAWLDTTREQMPMPTGTTPEDLSLLLSQTAIALHQPVAQASLRQRQNWYEQAMRLAEQEVQKILTLWLHYPDHLRAGWGRIEQLGSRLPDVWPLVWLLPLARAWFAHEPPAHDGRLTELLYHLLQRQWMALQKQIATGRTAVADPLRQVLDMLDQVATRQIQAAEIETLLNTTPPDYAAAFRKLTPLREALPLDARLLALERRIAAGMAEADEVIRLRMEITTGRQGLPTRPTQQRIQAAQEQLRRLGYPDEGEAEQRQLVEHLATAQAVCAAARIAVRDGDYVQARRVLAQWPDDAVIQTSAPDLAAALSDLVGILDSEARTGEHAHAYRQIQRERIQEQQARQQWQQDQQAIKERLAAADLRGALQATLRAYKLTRQMPEIFRQFQGASSHLARTLQALVQVQPLLLQGDYQAAQQICVPDAPLEARTLAALTGAVQELIRQGVALRQATRLTDLHTILRVALKQMRDPDLPPGADRLWRVLHSETLARLEQGLITLLEKQPVDQRLLPACAQMIAMLIEEVDPVTRPDLKYAHVLLQYHQERRQHVALEQQQAEMQKQQVAQLQALEDTTSLLEERLVAVQTEQASTLNQLHALAQRVDQMTQSLTIAAHGLPEQPECVPLAVQFSIDIAHNTDKDNTLENLLFSPEHIAQPEQAPAATRAVLHNPGTWLSRVSTWLKRRRDVAPATADASTPTSNRNEEIQ
jgi:hypothetical protein